MYVCSISQSDLSLGFFFIFLCLIFLCLNLLLVEDDSDFEVQINESYDALSEIPFTIIDVGHRELKNIIQLTFYCITLLIVINRN